MKPLGQHYLLECDGVAATVLADPEQVRQALELAAQAAAAHVVFGHCHHFGAGQGVTGVLLLRESHISIHTWPEHGYAAIDVFMCGDARPERAIQQLIKQLQPLQHRYQLVQRSPAWAGSVAPHV
jgi:S-adenosylmethionine decarboxylase